eukprot:CAMPEP_0202434498 /NCGR_PEP_ID=MMETSP1345-20130828/15296_1 /ASSEMBLY_ACC=CAM_ASM_000843 /TAXON_ID=342563 /ORGANISM="Fabrea Fabrea salina" /LENGTH=352 /DNA_ID=CAMNT_0049047175 /DNA_START=85 /DNA_END=1143 /DNA_ORIENTATION=-
MQSLKTKGRDDVTDMMGDEISRIIANQKTLEQKYSVLVSERAKLTGIANKQKQLELKEEIKEISNALRENTKHLCRVLKDNPNLEDNLVKIEKDRQILVNMLNDLNGDLQTLNFASFAYKVADELQQQDLLQKQKQLERETSQNVKQLQEDYKKELAEYQNETKEAQQEIQRRRDELADAKTYQNFKVKYEEKEKNSMFDCQLRYFQEREEVQKARVEELKKKRQIEQTVHERLQKFMDSKLESIGTEGEEWKNKHKEDKDQLEKKIQEMSEKKEKAKERLELLMEEIEQEKTKQTQREREEKEREDKIKEEREDNERKTRGAEVLAREFLKYKELVATTKKGKKGGKKKKK